jgi:class 3 adenylate cyclase
MESSGSERGARVNFLTNARYNLYKHTHGGKEPWDRMKEKAEHYARVGTATRCKVCGLSIRGPLGWVNRAFWGVQPLAKHPDLCNVCRFGERLLEVTVLFADARGFTRFAEEHAPDEVADTLNVLFEGCTQIILEHDGIVDKLMGDAVMAFFGAPIIRSDHALQAVKTAAAIQKKARTVFPADWKGACMRIGINSGAAFVGRIGSSDMKDYTAVGDVVNVAQRLQTEAEPGEILVSGSVYHSLGSEFGPAERRILNVKGREERVAAYALQQP